MIAMIDANENIVSFDPTAVVTYMYASFSIQNRKRKKSGICECFCALNAQGKIVKKEPQEL